MHVLVHAHVQSYFHMEIGKEKFILAVKKYCSTSFTFNEEIVKVYVWSEKHMLLNVNTSLVLCLLTTLGFLWCSHFRLE